MILLGGFKSKEDVKELLRFLEGYFSSVDTRRFAWISGIKPTSSKVGWEEWYDDGVFNIGIGIFNDEPYGITFGSDGIVNEKKVKVVNYKRFMDKVKKVGADEALNIHHRGMQR